MREYFTETIRRALTQAGIETAQEIQLEKPADSKFGDFSTNIALVLAKECKKNPRQLAEEISGHLSFEPGTVGKTEIAGPGFINFYLEPAFIMRQLEQVIEQAETFGQGVAGK